MAVDIVKNNGIAPGSLSMAIFSPNNVRLNIKMIPGTTKVTMLSRRLGGLIVRLLWFVVLRFIDGCELVSLMPLDVH